MNKTLKSLLAGICILSTSVSPISIFAANTENIQSERIAIESKDTILGYATMRGTTDLWSAPTLDPRYSVKVGLALVGDRVKIKDVVRASNGDEWVLLIVDEPHRPIQGYIYRSFTTY